MGFFKKRLSNGGAGLYMRLLLVSTMIGVVLTTILSILVLFQKVWTYIHDNPISIMYAFGITVFSIFVIGAVLFDKALSGPVRTQQTNKG